jgi:hypothetical protein
MAVNSEYQNVYARIESAYDDTVADFSDGVKVRTVGLVDLSGVKRGLIDAGVVRTDADDAGVAPVQGLDEGEIKIEVQMSGNTRNVAELAEDNMSKFLQMCVGTRYSELNDETLADCTTTVIKATAHPYEAGDFVMIGGEVRRVATDDGADQFTLDFALSAAPSVGTVIYAVEHFDPITNITGVGIGVGQVDSEMQYAMGGCNPTGIEIKAFAPGEVGTLSATFAVGNYATTTLTAATASTGTTCIVTGKLGPGLQIKLANGSIYEPATSTCTAALGLSREWIADIGSANGKAGTVAGPTDATLEATMYQDTTLSKIEALIGVATVINVQVGNAAGYVWGIYYPEAFLSVAPAPEKIGIAQGVKATFKASRGLLYRG